MNEFDRPIERRGSASFKWDDNLRLFGRSDVLPFWVADMDFATPEPIVRAIRERLQHPVLGYGIRTEEFFEAITAWLDERHEWKVQRDWLMFCPPSAIVGIHGLVTTLTEPGDSIIVPTPNYGPLLRLVDGNDRRLLAVPMREEALRFAFDFDALAAAVRRDTRMLIFSNPHNPTGRVFSRDELLEIARFAERHSLIVVADEVHSDLVLRGQRHVPYVDVAGEQAVTVLSPNKTFNTAGLPQSTFVIPDVAMRESFARFLHTVQLNHESTFGAVAAMAGYRHCGPWLDRLLQYLEGNHRRLGEYLQQAVPALSKTPAEGTYLAWLDARGTGLDDAALQRRLIKGGLALYAGGEFGSHSAGFLRMNLACPRATLEQGLKRLARALVD